MDCGLRPKITPWATPISLILNCPHVTGCINHWPRNVNWLSYQSYSPVTSYHHFHLKSFSDFEVKKKSVKLDFTAKDWLLHIKELRACWSRQLCFCTKWYICLVDAHKYTANGWWLQRTAVVGRAVIARVYHSIPELTESKADRFCNFFPTFVHIT